MATLRNKRKLAAVTREIQDENPRNGQSRNTSVPRINEDYLTQLSEEIEGRITKKLSREFSRIESRILDALPKLDEVLSNQQIQTHSKTVPGTFRNTNVENQGTNEDDSQSHPHPEGGLFRSQTTQNSGPEAGHYKSGCVWHRNENFERRPLRNLVVTICSEEGEGRIGSLDVCGNLFTRDSFPLEVRVYKVRTRCMVRWICGRWPTLLTAGEGNMSLLGKTACHQLEWIRHCYWLRNKRAQGAGRCTWRRTA